MKKARDPPLHFNRWGVQRQSLLKLRGHFEIHTMRMAPLNIDEHPTRW